jgi:hypothetical protein
MQMIPLHRSKEDLLQQYDCLIQIDNFNNRRDFRMMFGLLLIFSVFVLLLYVVTPVASLMVVKGISLMLLAMGWVLLLPVIIWRLIKQKRAAYYFKKAVEAETATGKQYFLGFDEQRFVFGSDDFRDEFDWTHFSHYLESPSTVLLFSPGAK